MSDYPADYPAEMRALAILEAEHRVLQDGRRLMDLEGTDDPDWLDREALLAAAVNDDAEGRRRTIHLLAHMFATMVWRIYREDALGWVNRWRWAILEPEDGDRA
ncbi:MAG TPA: hypothetical protein VF678_02700 [bacterium]